MLSTAAKACIAQADIPLKATSEQQYSSSRTLQPAKQSLQKQKTMVTCQLICFLLIFIISFLLLSELQLKHYPEHFASSMLATLGRPQESTQETLPLGVPETRHWTQHVYGYMLTVRLFLTASWALHLIMYMLIAAATWRCGLMCRVQTPHPTLACGGTSLPRCSPPGEHLSSASSAVPPSCHRCC